MLQLIVWFVCATSGARTEQLDWRPFVTLLIGATIAVALSTALKVPALDRMGEDGSQLWSPSIFAGNVAITFGIWAVIYLGGYAVGRWKRRRKGEGHLGEGR